MVVREGIACGNAKLPETARNRKKAPETACRRYCRAGFFQMETEVALDATINEEEVERVQAGAKVSRCLCDHLAWSLQMPHTYLEPFYVLDE